MTINTTDIDTILNTLAESVEGMTMNQLSQTLCMPFGRVRENLNATTLVQSSLTNYGEGGRRVRIFTVTDGYRLRCENTLHMVAESGSDDALSALSAATLYQAATIFGCSTLRKKDTKAKLISKIKAERERLGFFVCRTSDCNEAVDSKGERCCVCEDATPKTRTTRRSSRRSAVTGAVRKPDVVLDLSADLDTNITTVVAGTTSARGAQRTIAGLLADTNDGFIDAEVLRTILRKHGRLSAPNFTVNMKKDGFVAVRDGRTLKGWTRS